MVKKRTTFVIGAGASVPYGFPTADDLRQLITKNPNATIDRNNIRGRDHPLTITPEDAARLAERFEHSGLETIDAFLGHRPEFVELGKNMIATQLVPLEAKLHELSLPKNDWHALLFNRLSFGLDPRASQNISFVIFNYDRSLELRLTAMLANSTNQDLRDAWDKINELRIHHVYGTLDAQIELKASSYAPRVNQAPSTILKAARGIRVISEHRDGNTGQHDDMTKAIAAVQSAERLIFLGFGYDQTNLARIGIGPNDPDWDRSNAHMEIYGTAFGLLEAEISDVRRKVHSKIQLGGPNDDSLAFLRKFINFND